VEHVGADGRIPLLRACRGDDYLVRVRCRAILDEFGAVPAELHPTAASLLLEGARAVKFAYLESDDAETAVQLRLYPGDTLEQSRVLYVHPVRVDKLLALRDQGWAISPNFHFGYMETGMVWTTGDIGAEEYVSYWCEHIGATSQVRRDDWSSYFDGLIDLRIASEDDRDDFDRNFTHTKRAFAAPRPGLAVDRSWPFDSAAELDHAHRFGREVHDSINTVLRTLGEPEL
jgi:hypothetical protein